MSWNLSTLSDIIERFGQPPCEAVSWNIISTMCTHRMTVSLLVRLWVEIWKILQQYYRKEGQPPCEAVSWNGITRNSILSVAVSLLVRLWVEIYFRLCSWLCDNWSASLWGCELKCPPRTYTKQTCVSASLWGCELKYQEHHTSFAMTTVSLLVRLWVEIHITRIRGIMRMRQPPCEAVSWNTSKMNVTHKKLSVSLLVRLWVEIKL